jgi:PiT family inorganic phosphate transporter
MLSAFPPTSTAALAVLGFCFVLVLAFEFSNGFHDTANAVATVIYTHCSSRSGPSCSPAG